MKHVFLDANVILDFYRFGKDDLSEMQKVIKLVDDDEIRLYSNRLLKDEVMRLREAEVAKALSSLRSENPNVRIPKFATSYAEANALREALKIASLRHRELMEMVEKDAKGNELAADILVETLFQKSVEIEINDELLDAAKRRQLFGNPPRKSGDLLADALHWECLLRKKGIYCLHLVSRDPDFNSELSPGTLKRFLVDEWQSYQGRYNEVSLHSNISTFFKSQFPNIVLTKETQKDILIKSLAQSGSFAETHHLIEQLSMHDHFTYGQVRRLFEALASNNQVYWIGEDDDVKSFYLGLEDKNDAVPEEIQERVSEALGVAKDDFFAIPF